MFYKLILNAFPNHFNSKSIYAHYPLVVPNENAIIMESLRQTAKYSWERPSRRMPSLVNYPNVMINEFSGSKTSEQAHSGLLSATLVKSRAYHAMNLIKTPISAGSIQNSTTIREDAVVVCQKIMQELLKSGSYEVRTGSHMRQVDVVADLIIPTTTLFTAELLNLPLANNSVASSLAYTQNELYGHLSNIYTLSSSESNGFDKSFIENVYLVQAPRFHNVLEEIVNSTIKQSGLLSRFFSRHGDVSSFRIYGATIIRELFDCGTSRDDIVQKHL